MTLINLHIHNLSYIKWKKVLVLYQLFIQYNQQNSYEHVNTYIFLKIKDNINKNIYIHIDDIFQYE